jgi:tetratricopeptide (TPR) repeat protein
MTSLRRIRAALLDGRALPAFLVGALAMFVYANTLDAGFVWDDASSVLLHQHVKDPSKIFALFAEDQHAYAGGQGNFYRPLLAVSFMADYALARLGRPPLPPAEIPADLSPFLFHLSSALWHAAAAVLLLLYLRRLRAPLSVVLPAAAVFAVHPLHTEAVAYISGRGDSMAAAFMFAGLCFSTWRDSRRAKIAGAGLMLLCFAAALLSKEAAFIFPALLLLGRIAAPGPTTAPASLSWRSWANELLAIAMVALYFTLRATVLNFGSDTVPRAATWGTRLEETFQAFALYLRLLFVPTGLHMERSLDGVPAWLAVLGVALFIAILSAAILAYRRGLRRAAFGLAWFLAAWLPISGLFPLNAPMAEHWMYVPMAGFFFGLAELLHVFLHRPGRVAGRRAALAAFAVWLVLLSALTITRNRDWRDDESLYTATLRQNPASTRVHFNLAVVDQDILDNPVGARRNFLAVTRTYEKRKAEHPEEKGQFWSDELEAHLSLADLYAADYRYEDAYPHYSIVLGVAPTGKNAALVAQAALGLGRCYLATGDVAAARALLEQAARLAPALRPAVSQLLSPASLAP